MKVFGLLCSSRGRYLLAFGAGVMQAASFPRLGFSWLAWLAPALILFASLGQPKTFRIGYCAGLGHYMLSLGWLLRIPLPGRALVAWLAVSGYLALYTAAWSWVCWKLFPQKSALSPQPEGRPRLSSPRRFSIWDLLRRAKERHALPQLHAPSLNLFRASSWMQRAGWAFACAAAWVGMEMAIARIITGFPWNLLGASQYKALPLIQIASVLGVYGVSFLIVWFSVSFVSAAIIAWQDRVSPTLCLREVALALIGILAALGFGFKQLARPEPAARELKIALVQPSIPQPVIWDPAEKINRFHKLVVLSQKALEAQPDLLVWPEAAMPDMFSRFNPMTYDAITNLIIPHKVWMVMGADDALPKTTPRASDEVNFFNGSFLVDPAGQLVSKYYKRQLVLLGEYMPFADSLPFLKYLRNTRSGFTPGERPVPFEMTAPRAKIAVVICFEDVFPQLVRKYVDVETDFILNLTNNGWFGQGAAQWQHAVSALFRAIENGLPLVRCTNNGLTCWIDAQGRLHDVYFPGSRDIYQEGFKIAKIPLRAGDRKTARTIYHRYGDWFGWGCLAATFANLICSFSRKAR